MLTALIDARAIARVAEELLSRVFVFNEAESGPVPRLRFSRGRRLRKTWPASDGRWLDLDIVERLIEENQG